jgi:hypothetical protein
MYSVFTCAVAVALWHSRIYLARVPQYKLVNCWNMKLSKKDLMI